MKRETKGNLLLLLAAAIWGFAFSAQNVAADYMGAFTLNGIRMLIGALVLIPFIALRAKKSNTSFFEKDPVRRRDLTVSGILCGFLLAVATNVQQIGIAAYPDGTAASGRSGFITALYMVMVPIFSLFLHKKAHWNVWLSVALATVGMYLLCFGSGISGFYWADLIVLCCAVGFAAQIMVIDRYSDRVDGVKLSCVEFIVCSFFSFLMMAFFETPNLSSILCAWWAILYMGLLSSGLAYTLQIVAQQMTTNPTTASILMSMESVFAALGGVIFLHERFSAREMLGCAIMFAAILLTQIPQKEK